MIANQDQISVSSDDLQVLDNAGINKDDLSNLIHEAAQALNRERTRRHGVRPTQLSLGERAILLGGGAVGVDGKQDDDRDLQLTLMGLQISFRQIHNDSLGANQVAELLGITAARVRQLSLPAKRGLYSFRGLADERRYPQWQFYDGKVIPYLREILSALSLDAHPVIVDRFMTTPIADLEAAELAAPPSPRDWLIAGYKVAPVLELVRDI